MKLSLEVDTPRVVQGEQTTGRVRVLEGGPSRSLTVTLAFHERAGELFATPLGSSFVVHEGELVSGQTLSFSFTMPPEAPASFRGEHSELWWELDVRSDEPGLDSYARSRVEVVAVGADN